MLKTILSKSPFLNCSLQEIKNCVFKFMHRKDAKISSLSPPLLSIKKDFRGSDNTINIESSCKGRLSIRIRGHHNNISIGHNCVFGDGCSLWIEGNKSKILIGSQTTMTATVHINCQENDKSITIGEDCMFSNNIIIRTSDSHPIYDKETSCRINPAKDIQIGDHVWIAPNTKIMKGAVIGGGGNYRE